MTRRSTSQFRSDRAASARRSTSATSRLPLWLRVGVFGSFAVVVAIVAVSLVIGRLQLPGAPVAGAMQVRASMEGFDPNRLTVTAGQRVDIQFARMETGMHSDGGGWEEFAIDSLGIDWKVGPESSQVFSFTAPSTPGEYEYYCDICCGGKANPSMQGKLTVTA